MKPPKKYKTIKQPPGSSICGACLVAMITGQPLHIVRSRLLRFRLHGTTYYSEAEIIRYLARQGVFTGMRAVTLDDEPLTIDTPVEFKWHFTDGPAILAVKSQNFKEADHWIFWDGEHVRDPASDQDTNKLEEYQILEVIPIQYRTEYRPTDKPLHGPDCGCITCTTRRQHRPHLKSGCKRCQDLRRKKSAQPAADPSKESSNRQEAP